MQDTQNDYSGYDVGYMVRKVVFPDGSRETLVRRLDLWRGSVDARPARLAFVSHSDLEPDARAEANRARAVRRARQQLRWACLSISADRLLTLTYRENVTDRARVLSDWDRFRRLVMARFPDWLFVAVIEPQERGALHLHVAVVGHQPVKYLRACWWRIVGEGQGNIDVAMRKRKFGTVSESWDAARIAGYLCKYLSKDFDSLPKGSRRFFGSKNRLRPVVDRWWMQARTLHEAVEVAYRATCGGRAIGVRQWLSSDGLFYWIASPPVPDVPPPF